MKTVWIFNHYAIPPELGPLTRHFKLGEKLVQRGYDIKIFSSSALHYLRKNMITSGEKYLEKSYHGVPFVFVKTSDYFGNGKKRILNMFQYAVGVLKVTRKIEGPKPDIIYASSAHPLTWIAGYILSKRYKAEFIAETRDLWPESLVKMGEIGRNSIPAKILYTLEELIYRKADKLIFTFPGGIDYASNIRIDTDKIYNINNGVDLLDFNLKKAANVYQNPILLDEKLFKVVYTGSLGKPNAVHNLIYAAKILKDQGFSDIKILIFGDGTERSILEKYVMDNNLDNVSIFGRVDKDMIPSILVKSDLNIITGLKSDLYQYGLSLNKMFEYFAAGKPILSNVKCGYDLLEKYECGVTVEGDQPQILAEGIIRYYEMNQKTYMDYCDRALEASKDFDFEKLADILESMF